MEIFKLRIVVVMAHSICGWAPAAYIAREPPRQTLRARCSQSNRKNDKDPRPIPRSRGWVIRDSLALRNQGNIWSGGGEVYAPEIHLGGRAIRGSGNLRDWVLRNLHLTFLLYRKIPSLVRIVGMY